ncbi:hypothetical protein [Parabacteroides sp.]
MKQIILMAATALFGSISLMAQDSSVTLRAAFDIPTLLTTSPDSTIMYDENDKKSTKDENVFNENNFVTQTNHFTWEEATANWKPDGKTVNTLDSKGRPTTTIGYSAAGEENEKTDMTYEGDNAYPKTIISFGRENGSWQQEGIVNITNVKVNSAGLPTLVELSTTAEGMELNLKMEMTYDGDISMTKTSTDMMGSWSLMSETKSEIIDKGNPTITKSWGKSYFPVATDWTYNGKDYAYYSDHKPGEGTGNETITVEKPEWHLNGTTLEIPAAANGIEVYAVIGQRVASSRTSTIDLSTLIPGIYIAKTEKGNFKFMLK